MEFEGAKCRTHLAAFDDPVYIFLHLAYRNIRVRKRGKRSRISLFRTARLFVFTINLLFRSAADELIASIEYGSCVDQHLQDQLIIFMALAEGTSRIKTGPITLHTETAIHVASQLCDAKFRISQDGAGHVIECQGIGWRNPHF